MATKRKATDGDDGADGCDGDNHLAHKLKSGSDNEEVEVQWEYEEFEEKAWSIMADLPCIPSSYWISQGYDDNYATDVMDFLNEFKNVIHNIITKGMAAPHAEAELARSDEVRREELVWLWSADFNKVSLGVSLTPLLRSGGMIRHDDVLLPYWNKFAMALCQYYPTYLKCRPWSWSDCSPISIRFDLCNVQLNKTVLDILAPALKFNNVWDFELNNNDLDINGISFAMDFMSSKCQNLENICIANNPINCDLDTNLGAVQYNSIIRQITSKSPSIRSIYLNGNNISTLGNTALPDYLATDPYLEELYLMKNNYNDVDASAFAEALKSNTHLKRLNLTSNNVTNTGYQILIKAIFDPSSLNSVADSNHTCVIILEEHNKGYFEMSTINSIDDNDLKLRKKLKIFLALSAPNREYVNLSLLGNISSNAAIPSLLEFIQQYPEKHHWSDMVDPLLWQPSEREEVKIALQGFEYDLQIESFSSAREYQIDCEKVEKEMQVKSLNVLFQVYRDLAVPTIICNH